MRRAGSSHCKPEDRPFAAFVQTSCQGDEDVPGRLTLVVLKVVFVMGVKDAVSPASEKFSPPVTTHVVDRPRLHALLTDEIDAPVTFVAATAGWGKTLLAASWLAADASDRVTAWVTLEPIDDSPQIFWRTVARALTPSVGAQAAEVLHQVTASDVPEEDLPGTIAAALRNEPRRVLSCWTTCTRSSRQRCTRGCSGLSHTRRLRCCYSSRRVATRRGRWLSCAWRDWWPRCGRAISPSGLTRRPRCSHS